MTFGKIQDDGLVGVCTLWVFSNWNGILWMQVQMSHWSGL